jgi:hypothetical protein
MAFVYVNKFVSSYSPQMNRVVNHDISDFISWYALMMKTVLSPSRSIVCTVLGLIEPPG